MKIPYAQFMKFNGPVGHLCEICKKPITKKGESISEYDEAKDEVTLMHAKCYFKKV